MYIRSSYENMIADLEKFASAIYLAQSNIQSVSTVMTSVMEDDDEIKTTREGMNKLCISIAELAESARSVAQSLRDEIERIEEETRRRMQGDGGDE